MVCAQMEKACALSQELLRREGLLPGASMLCEVHLDPILINLEAS